MLSLPLIVGNKISAAIFQIEWCHLVNIHSKAHLVSNSIQAYFV